MSTKKKAVKNQDSGYVVRKAVEQLSHERNAASSEELASIERSKLFRQASTTEAGLLEYEKYAVEGLCEVITTAYAEVGMGGLLRSLMEVVQQCDAEAADAAKGRG
ncbi:hypothetical protein [Massilia sp. TWR1-2-2]|uniref:hypothetical protein n=1 Tax=Massilia sp. TWR1-2-2 TaxID=2804584 RepID=UPI003CF669EF